MNRCCICEARLSGTGWLCNRCATETTAFELVVPLKDVPVAEWPEWAKYLLAEEQRERRYDQTVGWMIV